MESDQGSTMNTLKAYCWYLNDVATKRVFLAVVVLLGNVHEAKDGQVRELFLSFVGHQHLCHAASRCQGAQHPQMIVIPDNENATNQNCCSGFSSHDAVHLSIRSGRSNTPSRPAWCSFGLAPLEQRIYTGAAARKSSCGL